MSRTYIYDTQELEKEFLLKSLADSEPQFISESISKENIHADAEIISVFVPSMVTRDLIEMMPNLKLIATRSTGYDHIDLDAAEEKGVVVATVPSYGENTVAEYAFGLLLSLTRKIPVAAKMTKENVCIPPEVVRGVDLSKKVLGVVGTGRIGKKLIAMGKGFRMNVIAYDTYHDAESAAQLGFEYVPLEKLLAEADVISLHMPATAENHHLLNKDTFSQMKNGVYIINTARGELIDTQALIEALKSGKVAGAGLDVCEGEELLKNKCSLSVFTSSNSAELLRESVELSILKDMPNVILTPHVAYDTVEALGRICQTTSDNITSFIHGNATNIAKKQKKVLGKLVLARHTQSEWNARGVWTGSRDAQLTDKGFQDSRLLGLLLEDIHIDYAYASLQVRSMETLSSMLGTMHQPMTPISRDGSLNERDYGGYTGKNKHEMKEILGDEVFEKVRRGWDVAIPQGETLKNVYDRVVPYYTSTILPRILRGENVLIVSHGNALRALIKYIETLSDEEIENTEMMFGGVVIYTLDEEGKKLTKRIRETPSVSYDHV